MTERPDRTRSDAGTAADLPQHSSPSDSGDHVGSTGVRADLRESPIPEPDERLAAIRASKAERARIRREFAERRRYGVAARHRNKINRNRKKGTGTA